MPDFVFVGSTRFLAAALVTAVAIHAATAKYAFTAGEGARLGTLLGYSLLGYITASFLVPKARRANLDMVRWRGAIAGVASLLAVVGVVVTAPRAVVANEVGAFLVYYLTSGSVSFATQLVTLPTFVSKLGRRVRLRSTGGLKNLDS